MTWEPAGYRLAILVAAATLSCGPRFATVILDSDPIGADVYQSGERISSTPTSLTWGPLDDKRCFLAPVQLRAEDCRDTDEEVIVCPKYLSRSAAEEHASRQKVVLHRFFHRSYTILTEPEGARLHGQEGVDYGTSPTHVSWTLPKSDCFDYTITARLAGFRDASQTFKLCPKFRTIGESDSNREPITLRLLPDERPARKPRRRP